MGKTLRNPCRVKFQATIIDAGSGGAYVEFPFNTEELFSTTGRVPVRVSFEGVPYRGSMVRMGSERHILIVLKEIRAKIQKTFGDEIEIVVELDEQPREIVLADDIQEELEKNAIAQAAFLKLAYSHQREYVLWIEAAKKDETRRRRIEKMITKLLNADT